MHCKQLLLPWSSCNQISVITYGCCWKLEMSCDPKRRSVYWAGLVLPFNNTTARKTSIIKCSFHHHLQSFLWPQFWVSKKPVFLVRFCQPNPDNQKHLLKVFSYCMAWLDGVANILEEGDFLSHWRWRREWLVIA